MQKCCLCSDRNHSVGKKARPHPGLSVRAGLAIRRGRMFGGWLANHRLVSSNQIVRTELPACGTMLRPRTFRSGTGALRTASFRPEERENLWQLVSESPIGAFEPGRQNRTCRVWHNAAPGDRRTPNCIVPAPGGGRNRRLLQCARRFVASKRERSFQ